MKLDIYDHISSAVTNILHETVLNSHSIFLQAKQYWTYERSGKTSPLTSSVLHGQHSAGRRLRLQLSRKVTQFNLEGCGACHEQQTDVM